MTTELEQAVKRMHTTCKKIQRWLVKSAEACEHNAKDSRFPAYADDCARDAKDYRATAKDVRAAIAAYEEAKRLAK